MMTSRILCRQTKSSSAALAAASSSLQQYCQTFYYFGGIGRTTKSSVPFSRTISTVSSSSSSSSTLFPWRKNNKTFHTNPSTTTIAASAIASAASAAVTPSNTSPTSWYHHNSSQQQEPLVYFLSSFSSSSSVVFQRRWMNTSSAGSSSSSNKSKSNRSANSRKGKGFHLDALPFSISPEQALDSFRKWAEDDQGLRYLLNYGSVRIGAAYVPVWSFDLNIRFYNEKNHNDSNNNTKYKQWKPPMFAPYEGHQSTIYLPGLSSYAGYSYRRSLIHPVHSTTLVFMGDKTQPFGAWMLRDMKLQQSGAPITVVPDAWNATEGRSFAVIKEELQAVVDSSWPYNNNNDNNNDQEKIPPPKVQTQVVNSRRVYMPTFVIDYQIMGLSYRAFLSGCDQAAPIAGVSHQLFGPQNMFQNPEFHQSSRDFLMKTSSGIQQFSPMLRQAWPLIIGFFRPLFKGIWFLLMRIWVKLPIIGIFGGAFAGFKKIYQPYMDDRTASAEWERQRDHEGLSAEEDDWIFQTADFYDDDGNAVKYFFRNKQRILHHLSGDMDHEEGQYDWYKDWEAWAQQQWAKQQQQSQQQSQQGYYYQQQQQQKSSSSSSSSSSEYHWDFDVNDPYSVLGVSRNASKKEISQAFRLQMLKHHPDTQSPNASEAQKQRAVERSKIITDAYRKIKSSLPK